MTTWSYDCNGTRHDHFRVFECMVPFRILFGRFLQDLPSAYWLEHSQIRRLFSHMIFTALCCYTTSGGLLHCNHFSHSIDLAKHASRRFFHQFSDASCTITAWSQKISARFEWQFLQRRVHYERLRSSICTCTWGGNDIDPFSLVSFLFFGGFSLACQWVIFTSIRIAQTSCIHTPLPLHFFLPTLHQLLDP